MVKKSNVQICRWCAKCQTCQYSNLYKLLYKGVAKVAQLSSKIGASCSRYGWSTLGSAPLLQSTGASNARGVDRNFLPRIPSLFRNQTHGRAPQTLWWVSRGVQSSPHVLHHQTSRAGAWAVAGCCRGLFDSSVNR